MSLTKRHFKLQIVCPLVVLRLSESGGRDVACQATFSNADCLSLCGPCFRLDARVLKRYAMSTEFIAGVNGARTMSGTEKKQQERYILERFLETLDDKALPKGDSFVDSESPDFLLGPALLSPLGIEISELNHPGLSWSGLPLRQEEGIQDHLCSLIEARWDATRIPFADIRLAFIGRHFPAKNKALEFAEAVLATIEAHMPDKDGEANVSREQLWQHPVLGPQLDSLKIFRWRGFHRPFVTASRGAFLPPLEHSLLQDVLSKKNARFADYRLQCDKVWLVIAHHASELSSHFSPHEAALNDTYAVAFDRAFVLDVMGKHVAEIKKHDDYCNDESGRDIVKAHADT